MFTQDRCSSTSSTVFGALLVSCILSIDVESARSMGYAFINFKDVDACEPSEDYYSMVSVYSLLGLASAVPRCAESHMPACRDWKGHVPRCISQNVSHLKSCTMQDGTERCR